MSLILDKINYVYSEGTAYQIQALKDVNLEIRDGQFIGVIGHTLSISYLRQPFSMMCVLDRKIRDCPRKKQDCAHSKH